MGTWGNRKRTIRGLRFLTQQTAQTQQTQHFLTAGELTEIQEVQWENAVPAVPENQDSPTTDPAKNAPPQNAGSEPIRNSADLVAWFRNHSAEDVSTDDLIARCPAPNAEDIISTNLATMERRGDIFQIKPGRWRAL